MRARIIKRAATKGKRRHCRRVYAHRLALPLYCVSLGGAREGGEERGGERRKSDTASHLPCNAVLRSRTRHVPFWRDEARKVDGISAFPNAGRAKIRVAFRYSFRIAVTARHAFLKELKGESARHYL